MVAPSVETACGNCTSGVKSRAATTQPFEALWNSTMIVSIPTLVIAEISA
jgi:hypothetical protein